MTSNGSSEAVADAKAAGRKAKVCSAGRPRYTISRRMKPIVVIVLVMVVLLALRLVLLQVAQAESLAKTASDFRSRSFTQQAERGRILDSDGGVLAASTVRYNVRVDQKAIQDFVQRDDTGAVVGRGAAAAARVLAPALKMDQAELGGILLGGESKKQWVLLAKGLTPEQWRSLDDLNVHGIYPERYVDRIYPNGSVAGSILGFVGRTAESDEVSGRAGIEQVMNDVLAGTDGALTVEVGPDGTVYPQAKKTEVKAENGRDVQLTLNLDLQQAAETALNDSVRRNGADWGSAVVVEVGTGRILAMADTVNYDPSKVGSNPPKSFLPNAVGAVIEPGSVGKVVTFSTAVEKGKITPQSVFTTPYRITMPNGESFKDDSPHPTETLTATGVMAKSYNTGLVQIGDRVDEQTRYEYLKKFGFGSRTGVELAGEEPGILRDPSTWDNRTHYTAMFGQSYAVTPLQLAQMVSVVASGGVKHPVHLVDGEFDSAGNFIPKVVAQPTQVISKDTADTIREMMQGVTKKGATAPNAAVEGYNVAGKTGTAQVLAAGGGVKATVGSFVGMIPAENPKIAVAVSIYKSGGVAYGGVVSAPVFSQIATHAMRLLHVSPSTVPLSDLPWAP